jgi:hypothetical protein
MGHSPFTGISITQDYHYNVHTDSNDFSYSFFGLVQMVHFFLLHFSSLHFFLLHFFLLHFFLLLLFSLFFSHHLVFCCVVLFYVGTTTKGQDVRFYLLELKKFFEPKIGDVMLIKVSLI